MSIYVYIYTLCMVMKHQSYGLSFGGKPFHYDLNPVPKKWPSKLEIQRTQISL